MASPRLRLLLDEDTEQDLAEELTAVGHDVERCVDVGALGPGADDSAIRAYASREDQIVVTHDEDHVAAVRADGPPPRVFWIVPQRLPVHEQAALIATALEYVNSVEDLPPTLPLTEAYLE